MNFVVLHVHDAQLPMDQASFFYHSSDQMIAASWCYGGYGLLEWPEDWTGLLVGRQVNRTRAVFEV